MDKISIIIPFKNEENFLHDCLQSIFNQTLDTFAIEIILIDDHSTDRSAEIAQKFCLQEKHFYYFSNTGNGVVEALQLGLDKSTGNFIHRMDADDIMPPLKLVNLYQQFVRNPKLNIATGKVKYFRNDQKLGDGYTKYQEWLNGLIDQGSFYSNIYQECPVASANWLMRKADLLQIGGFGNVYPEDYDLIFRAYVANYQIGGSAEVTHHWRDHQQRASRTSPLYADNNFYPLKLHWFLKTDHDSSVALKILGAGKKGKAVAKILLQNNMPFRWYTNNTNKIGHNIYGITLENEQTLFDTSGQLIVVVSNPIEKNRVIQRCLNNGMNQGMDFFVFN